MRVRDYEVRGGILALGRGEEINRGARRRATGAVGKNPADFRIPVLETPAEPVISQNDTINNR